MVPCSLNDRVEMLINELMDEGGLVSASLASILLAAQDSVKPRRLPGTLPARLGWRKTS